jgi:uncharacterized membrane protein YraQ (UPF0718 family)
MMDFAQQFVWNLWVTVTQMAPYLLFGFLLAGILSVWISPKFVERHLGGRGLLPVLKASAFGVPLPLCSCGVIPVSMSLRQHGASKGATVAFLLSTPQTGLDNILVAYSLLGPVFALACPVVTFVTGLFGGAVVDLFDGGESGPKVPAVQANGNGCCAGCKEPRWRRALRYGFVNLPGDIGRSVLIGVLIAAAITAAVPEDFFGPILGGGLLAMMAMAVISAPVYVCATASIPVAVAMIAKGVSPGAALVFLMVGPATNAATIVTVWSKLGRRTAVLYLASVIVCAIAAGLAMDAFWPGLGADITAHFCQETPGLLGHVSAAVLLAMLVAGAVRKNK